MNRFNALKNWLEACPYLDSYIYFNVLPSSVGSTAIMSDSATNGELNSFINGDKDMELLFNIEITTNYDKGTSDINMDAMTVFENISGWVKEQNKAKNYPNFGEDMVYLIEPAYINADVYINEKETQAIYQAKYKVNYIEKG